MVEIDYAVTDGIARITLNAPKRRNALTVPMAGELTAALRQADADTSVAVTVLSGGPSFCAGADMGVLDGEDSEPSSDESYRTIDALYRSFTTVGSIGTAVIAAVRGPSVGAGLNLALAADLRVVSRTARLISGFARIGLHPGGGHYALLDRVGGREVAAGVGLFGRKLSGARAAELGLAWEAVDDEDVEPRALELAASLAGDLALARRLTASFRRTTQSPAVGWDAALEMEHAPQMWSFRRRAGSRAAARTGRATSVDGSVPGPVE